VSGSLPELIAFYEDHAEHRDKFEVLAVHDQAAKSLADLDQKLVRVKKQNWQGKDLPFPILLDGQNRTHKRYGINSWPTTLLIDPDGKLVGHADVSSLEEKLPALSSGQRWARYRDLKKNVFWSFEPKENTLTHLADILKRWSRCDITIDTDAVKAAGLTADQPLPGFVIGSSITLRSIDELLLAPHGLGVAPSPDGKTLVITKRTGKQEPMSYLQKLHAEELNGRLNGEPGESARAKENPLALNDRPLLEAIRLVAREYNLPMALDAKAMQDGRVDPERKVSGTIDPGRLRASLVKLLEPLGLTIEVRHETVAVIEKK
jgi:hypothetical protein